MHVMLGYAMHIRRLTEDDVRLWKIDLGDAPLDECVAVHGEDLGECLTAVVRYNRNIWVDEGLVWVQPDHAKANDALFGSKNWRERLAASTCLLVETCLPEVPSRGVS